MTNGPEANGNTEQSVSDRALIIASEISSLERSHGSKVSVIKLTESRRSKFGELSKAEREGNLYKLRVYAYADSDEDILEIRDSVHRVVEDHGAKIARNIGIFDNVSRQPFGVDPEDVFPYGWSCLINVTKDQVSQDS